MFLMKRRPTYADLEERIRVLEEELINSKRGRGAFREDEELLHILSDNALVGIYIIQDDRLVYVNQTMADIFGYSPDELIGADSLMIIHPDDQALVAENIRRRVAGEVKEVRYEFRGRCKNGATKLIDALGSRVDLNDRSVIFGNLLDITERKRAEDELRRTESMFRSFAEQSFVGISIIQDGVFKYVNPIYAEIHGYRVEELTDHIPVLDLVHPDDRPIVAKRIETRIAGGTTSSRYECRKVKKTGETISVELYGAQGIYNGKPAVIGVLLDITERKRLEEQRLNLEERLHRAEKMEALGTLAGGVAHDLNNVLGVLTGYSELLQEEIPAGNRLRKYVDNILASSEKGASIINDLLTLARRGVTVSSVVNLNNIVSDFLKTPVYEKLQTYHPQVVFRTDLSVDLLNIKGSAFHLEKTMMNLISNAAESISGTGEVTIRTENRYLDRALRGYDHVEKGEYVALMVSDTGRGIPAEDLGKIFEPFYTKKVMGRSGTGLGLAVVWGTVKDHDGYIDVRSIEEKGTTFTLYFPATRDPADDDTKKMPVDQYLGHGELILVVDDLMQQREMAAQMLTKIGYKVHTVSCGEEAVEYLKTHKVDLMILDMIMDPGIDGLETYRRILQINPHQKAILVSGYSETERVKEAQRLGAGAYVRKPYILEKIGLAIRNELLKPLHHHVRR